MDILEKFEKSKNELMDVINKTVDLYSEGVNLLYEVIPLLDTENRSKYTIKFNDLRNRILKLGEE